MPWWCWLLLFVWLGWLGRTWERRGLEMQRETAERRKSKFTARILRLVKR